MQLPPNGTVVEGVVQKIMPEADGFGQTIEVSVKRAKAVKGKRDFLNATKGDVVAFFHSGPELVKLGESYRLVATVLGGPTGERNVVQKLQVGPA